MLRHPRESCRDRGRENWDRFRGPNGAGQGDAKSIPVEWTAVNYLWKRPLVGLGHSSPVVWGERVFVTSADPETAELIVTALDALSGEPVWERRFAGVVYSQHVQNSFATCTPAVDAERLYLVQRVGDTISVRALAHDGHDVWQRNVSKSSEKHGYGASPVLVNDLVYISNDNDVASDLTALDQKTGAIRWQVTRPNGETAFATPCLLDAAGGKKLLVTASTGGGLVVVDPATGKTAWQMYAQELPQRCVSSPVVAGRTVLVSCGVGNNGLHLLAVDAGQSGAAPRELYRITENVPNVTTPIVVGDLLFLWQDRGIVSCHDVATGERYWRQRIGGNFNSSPVSAGNRLYCPSRAGEMIVLAADTKYRMLARFDLGEATSATPAVALERIYLRTETSLMCIGELGSASE